MRTGFSSYRRRRDVLHIVVDICQIVSASSQPAVGPNNTTSSRYPLAVSVRPAALPRASGARDECLQSNRTKSECKVCFLHEVVEICHPSVRQGWWRQYTGWLQQYWFSIRMIGRLDYVLLGWRKWSAKRSCVRMVAALRLMGLWDEVHN